MECVSDLDVEKDDFLGDLSKGDRNIVFNGVENDGFDRGSNGKGGVLTLKSIQMSSLSRSIGVLLRILRVQRSIKKSVGVESRLLSCLNWIPRLSRLRQSWVFVSELLSVT
jgi:hypothetical protein